jgi:hypothetical protein
MPPPPDSRADLLTVLPRDLLLHKFTIGETAKRKLALTVLSQHLYDFLSVFCSFGGLNLFSFRNL